MKTFEQALGAVMGTFNHPPTEEDLRIAHETSSSTNARYKEMIHEVAFNQTVWQACRTMIIQVAAEEISVDEAMVTLFVHGLIVGIEMEKQEL